MRFLQLCELQAYLVHQLTLFFIAVLILKREQNNNFQKNTSSGFADTNGVTHSASESNVRQMRGPVGSGDQQHTGGVPTDSNDTNDADHKDTSNHTSLRRATAGEENDTAPLRSSQEDQTPVRKEATEERDQQEP